MSDIENDEKRKRLEVSAEVVKVVVMGPPRVGKTSFIRAFWEHHEPSPVYSYNGATVYPCKFKDEGIVKTALIFEIPSDPGFFEDHVLHNTDVNILVWMYATDDPASVDMLRNDWVPRVTAMVNLNRKLKVLLGNKRDLRDDPRVIARLAEEAVAYPRGCWGCSRTPWDSSAAPLITLTKQRKQFRADITKAN